MDVPAFEATFDKDSKVYKVFAVLRDRQWHCRGCEYAHVATTQIAGGAGIQGLQRGTKSRPGMSISSGDHYCPECDATTRHDRWTGHFAEAVPTGSMPRDFARRVVSLLGSRDVVEQTERPANQLTVDHKLPGIRWSPAEGAVQTDYAGMNDDDIRARFQLLKQSNGSVSHNLLKSRACERCFRDGRRGTPFGIVFFHDGGPDWAPEDKRDAAGCVGCGWYDFAEWRDQLNEHLQERSNG
ncbi:MAG: restriction endonuclease [Acidimicrobiia bacterium]|nr:restriction endonuclease [Acidimicrobiia bacterium]MYB23897.1 restriction endonuclease [Acidimicrobiia bacterium]MYJ14539.1 restriction endonuclease [Acidimicrobiia bacterium]